ncbi:MAG: LysE family translocator [Pseudomonadota bacterium]
MITPEFIALWIAWVLSAGSPGPATLGIIGTAMASGRGAGVAFALGICAGSATWGIAAAAGLAALMLANAWVFEVIRYAGAAYLGWLALKALRAAWLGGAAKMGTPFQGGAKVLFAKGAAIHLTNPKAVLGWGALFSIIVPAGASPAVLFQYFGVLYLASVIVFVGYALLFSSHAMVTAYARARRWFDLSFGLFFGFASFKILTAKL